jgi:hypothetical protein
MKKLTAIITLICLVFVVTACSNNKVNNNDEKINLIDISNYTQIKTEFENSKKKKYDNLSFSDNVDILYPENIESVSELKITPKKITNSELYDSYQKILKNLMGINEPETENSFFLDEDGSLLNAPDSPISDGAETEFLYPFFDEYKEQILSEELPVQFFLYQTDTAEFHDNDSYLLSGANMTIMNKGRFVKKLRDISIASWNPMMDYGEITANYIYPHTDKTEHSLPNGNMNISEITASAEKYLNDNLPEKMFANDYFVYRIQVLENAEFGQAFRLLFTPKENDVPFDYLENQSELIGDENREYVYNTAEVLMSKENDTEYIYGLNTCDYEQIGEKFTEIISLSSALNIINEEITNNLNFEISLIEFMYCPYYSDDTSNIQTAHPCWKITSYNNNDDMTYRYYVDALNGEFRYTSLRSI